MVTEQTMEAIATIEETLKNSSGLLARLAPHYSITDPSPYKDALTGSMVIVLRKEQVVEFERVHEYIHTLLAVDYLRDVVVPELRSACMQEQKGRKLMSRHALRDEKGRFVKAVGSCTPKECKGCGVAEGGKQSRDSKGRFVKVSNTAVANTKDKATAYAAILAKVKEASASIAAACKEIATLLK